MAGEMQTVFTKLAESAKHAHAYLSAEEELRGRSEKAEVKKAAKEEAKAVKKAGKAGKPKREPSAYNLFMKTELPKVKATLHPLAWSVFQKSGTL
jgi:sRNA-binding protein